MTSMMRNIVLIAGGLVFSWAVWAQTPIRDGRWEITMQMDMANMPIKMPPMKMTQCITKEQLKDPTQALPSTAQPGQADDCKVSDYKVEGNKVSWKVACTGREKMTGTGEITYKDDTYDGLMKMTTAQGEMTMKYAAKRLGECTP